MSMTARVVVTVISGFIIAVHLMLKELRTITGKLLMLYNLAVVLTNTAAVSMQNLVAPDSLMFCYTFTIVFLVARVCVEVLATCILHQVVYTMYCSNKLIRITPEDRRHYFRYYMIYLLGSVLLGLFFIVSFDVATRNYRSLLLPDGHCAYIVETYYSTEQIILGIIAINKVAQLLLFVAYLYYVYELSKDVNDPTILETQLTILRKLGFATGAVVGLHSIIYILNRIVIFEPTLFAVLAGSLFLVQQCVIVAIFMCSKSMRQLYGECLSKQ